MHTTTGRMLRCAVLLATMLVAACDRSDAAPGDAPSAPAAALPAVETPADGAPELARAIFAAGCFWCVEQAFDEVPGVRETISGYTGGTVPDPSYREVSSGRTGHYEAVAVHFDPAVVSYEALLEVFWRNVDPTDDGGQFCDRGSSYLGAIFADGTAQREAAEASLQALLDDPDAPRPIVTPVLDAAPFYAAEDYHQDYYLKNPIRYRYYKTACGRVARLEAVWGG